MWLRNRSRILGAVALVLMLALFVGSSGAVAAGPPCRFYGSVTIDGQPAEKGTAIRVWLQEGANTVWEQEIETGTSPAGGTIDDDVYLIDVPAGDLGVSGAQDGDTVYFSVEEMPAQTGTWASGAFVEHDLSVPMPTEPTIAFTPSGLSFSAVQGGANPQGQTLGIWNSGAGTLNWGVSDNAGWLSLSPANGSSTGEHDQVTASVNIAGMSAGVYSATITISAVGATNTPRTLGVSLTVTETEAATIAFGPSSLSFSAVAGQANPASKTLRIWNSGAGTLDWSVSDDAAWLALAPTSGSSSGEQDEVTVSVNTAGMSTGDYSATITISAAGATNTPRTLAVSLTITETEAPAIGLDPASLSFSAVAGEENPASKTLEIWNSGTGTLDWSLSDDAAWLTLAPTGGSSSGDQDVTTVTASANITGMIAGSYPATITIAAAGATNTPRTASVSLQISQGTNGTAESVATATGTGTAFFVSSQGSIEQLASVDEASLPAEGKPDLEFPHGFFSFNIVGSTPGDEVEVQITLPDSVPPDTQYWGYYDNEWHQIPMAVEPGDDGVITITLVDGGLGDGDGMADGVITDPGGPGYPSPVNGGAHHLSEGALVAISIVAGAAIIAGIVLLVRRRRGAVI